jgi:hypothetical protein
MVELAQHYESIYGSTLISESPRRGIKFRSISFNNNAQLPQGPGMDLFLDYTDKPIARKGNSFFQQHSVNNFLPDYEWGDLLFQDFVKLGDFSKITSSRLREILGIYKFETFTLHLGFLEKTWRFTRASHVDEVIDAKDERVVFNYLLTDYKD